MIDYFLLIFFCAAIYYWWDTITKREIAIYHGKLLAQQYNLQLLDDSVHCNKISLVRTDDNWPSIKRVYFFNISSNNENRLHCQLTLIGKTLTYWYVPPYPQLN